MINLSDKTKKSIAETTGLTFLADNLEQNLSEEDGKILKQTLCFYSTTTENIESVIDTVFPEIEKENPTLVTEKEFVELFINVVGTKSPSIFVNDEQIESNKIEVEKYSRVHVRIEQTGFETITDSFIVPDNISKSYVLSALSTYLEIKQDKIWLNDIPEEVEVYSNTKWNAN